MTEHQGKTGKYCPFREKHKCGDFCGLFCVGLKSCVFHAINKNIMDIKVDIEKLQTHGIEAHIRE